MRQFKVLVAGDSGVGKTSIVTKFSRQEFKESNDDSIAGTKQLVNTVLLQD